MVLSLDRLNWYSPDGIQLIDDLGVSRTIDKFSPALWEILLREAVQRGHERELGTKTGFASLKGKRARVDLVLKIARSSRTAKEGARLLVANACNAVWTRSRVTLAGYVVEDIMCELSGAARRHHSWEDLEMPAP
jgi:hypothetical protein